jgi:hypothetical protein
MVITEQMVYARLAMEGLETARREQAEAEAKRLEANAAEASGQLTSG